MRFRRAYTFSLKDKKQTDRLRRRIRQLGINAKAKWAGQMERTCGGAALFPILVGATGDLSEPLDLENPRIQKVRSIQQLEPRELTPVEWYEDLEGDEKFSRPKIYRLQSLSGGGGRIGMTGGVYIHESRLAIYPGEYITRQFLPGQRVGWGDSILNSTHEVIEDYGLSWGSAATILQNFSQRVFKYKGLDEDARGEEQRAARRCPTLGAGHGGEHLQRHRSRRGRRDGTGRDVDRRPVRSAHPAGAGRVGGGGHADDPPDGDVAGGLNATGEFDDKGWDDRVINRQDDHTDPVEWLISLEMLSTEGRPAASCPTTSASSGARSTTRARRPTRRRAT
jgi:hypothetical protein